MINQDYILIGLLAIGAYCLLTRENYEIFGFSGNLPKPDLSSMDIDEAYDMSKMKEVSVAVTPDLMQTLIFAVIKHIKSKTNLCVYAINVPYIRILGDDEGNYGYKARIMFMTTGGFPIGFETDVTVINDRVVQVRSQPRNDTADDVKPYQEDVAEVFLSFDQLGDLVKPKSGELPSEFGVADHHMKDNHYIY